MKIKKFNQMNEGMKVNPEFLSLVGEYDIEEVIGALSRIWKESEFQVGIFIMEVSKEQSIEMDNILSRLMEWKDNGATKVKGERTEWYPLWD